MLKAKDADYVVKVSSFLGPIEDDYCGNENADVTRAYTSYVNMVCYLYRRCELIRWGEGELQKLELKNRRFKTEGRTTFSQLLWSRKNGMHWTISRHVGKVRRC